jgi:insulysin
VDDKKTARRLSQVNGTEALESGQFTPSRDHTQLPTGNNIIVDSVQFKTKMELSPAAVPVINF